MSLIRLGLLCLLVTLTCARSFVREQPMDMSYNPETQHHIINKRSFHKLGCLGDYHSGYFSRLNRLCEDCYDMYKDVELRDMCRSRCFSTETFLKCRKALLINDEEERQIDDMIQILYGTE